MVDTPISGMTPFTPLGRMLVPVADPALGNGEKNGAVSISALVSMLQAAVAGTQIYSGSGQPGALLGNIGDYYIDVASGLLYGPKTNLGWPIEAVALTSAAENANANAIMAETARAEGQEATLTTNLANEVSARAAAITVEATARANADTTNANAITAETARAEGQEATKAAKGANSDITSLAGLTTPLSPAQGGTGKNALVTTSAGAASAGQVPALNSAGVLDPSIGQFVKLHIFTASGTLTLDPNSLFLHVILIGAGGGGGGGAMVAAGTTASGGAGGGGGGYSDTYIRVGPISTIPLATNTCSVAVGAGGAGGTGATAIGAGNPGSAGGNTGFITNRSASFGVYGGGGGGGGQVNAQSFGGGGGAAQLQGYILPPGSGTATAAGVGANNSTFARYQGGAGGSGGAASWPPAGGVEAGGGGDGCPNGGAAPGHYGGNSGGVAGGGLSATAGLGGGTYNSQVGNNLIYTYNGRASSSIYPDSTGIAAYTTSTSVLAGNFSGVGGSLESSLSSFDGYITNAKTYIGIGGPGGGAGTAGGGNGTDGAPGLVFVFEHIGSLVTNG